VIWATVAGVLLALWLALALLVRTASSTLRTQTRELRDRSRALMESYERLEASSLEAIESLTRRSTRRIPTPPVTRAGCSASRSRSRPSST
jgi:hypothetical protein